MNPLVSIIIPNYNHRPYLQERLDSVFGQTFQDFEVILLDDASTDGSQEVLEHYKDHPNVSHLVLNTENTGSPFKQWQKGINLAKGTYIWIAESDDYCEPDFLEQLLIKMDDAVGISYAQTIDVDDKGNRLRHRIEYTKNFNPNIWKTDFELSGIRFVEAYLSVKNVIPNASAVVFKKGLVTKRTFTASLLGMRMCGDWFFWIQLAEQSNVSFVAEELNYFRNHETISRKHTNLTTKQHRLLEERAIRLYLLEKNIENQAALYSLYEKWFKIHSPFSVFSPSFYEIKLPNTSIFTFLKLFFKYQF